MFARNGDVERQLRETRDIAVRAETKADGHMANCIEHNKRIEDMLSAQARAREAQHAENQEAIQDVHSRVSNIGTRVNTLVISALAATVIALLGALYAIFSHKIGLA